MNDHTANTHCPSLPVGPLPLRTMTSVQLSRMVLLLTAVGFVGCGAKPDDGSAADSTVGDGPCLDQCIVVREVFRLGPGPDGENPLTFGTLSAVRDSEGRTWIAQRDHLLVVDPAGIVVARVGRSGQGPLEFGRVRPVHADDEGNVFVIDNGNLRYSIVSRDLEVKQSGRMSTVALDAVWPDGVEGGFVLLGQYRLDASTIPHPLHSFYRSGDHQRSFGNDAPGVRRGIDYQGFVARTPSGFVSVPPHEYRVSLWDIDGNLARSFAGPDLNSTEILPGVWSEENPPPTAVLDVISVDETRVAILILETQADWRDHVTFVPDGQGRMGIELTADAVRGMFETRIDLIDIVAGERIAVTRFDRFFTGFVDSERLFSSESTTIGEPVVIFHDVEWASRQQ